MRNLNLEMLRRVAVSARAAASGAGHSELSIAISEEKNVYEAVMKLIAAKADAAVYSYKWARGETNKVIQDVFLKMCGLTSVWAEAQNEFAQKYKEYRGCLKEILHEEKSIDDVKKQQNTCASRLTKLKKQVDVARRKNDSSKLEPLLAELRQATTANDKAYEEVEEKIDYVEAFKARRLRESLLLLSEAYLTLAKKMTEIFSAQMQMAELITSDTVPNSNMVPDNSLYEACWEKNTNILKETCLKIGYPVPRLPGDRTSTLRTYVDRDSSPDTRFSPTPPSPSGRAPLPPPSQKRNSKILAGASSLDLVDIYASADDLTTVMPPKLPPRPSVTKPDYVVPDEQVVHVKGKKSGDVEKDASKSVKDGGKGKDTWKADDYSKVQDMYEWVWQRQSQILSGGDSGEYTMPFDLIPGREATGAGNKPVKVVREKSSAELPASKEDSGGYLLPAEAVESNKVKLSDTQGKSPVAGQQSETDTSCSTDPIDSGEYAYARVMTTTTKPYRPPSKSPAPKENSKSTSRPEVPPRPSRMKPTSKSIDDETVVRDPEGRTAKVASDSDEAGSS